MISPDEHYAKKRVQVEGHTMAYLDVGQGDPIVFLHGNPTSCYVWRNIIPHVEGLGRCIAPDLIGMGDSDKLKNSGPDRYRFVEHRKYLDGFLAALDITQNVILVVHDWGSGLGFDWANRHRDAVKGVAYMESIVCPARWEGMNETFKSFLKGVRSPAGEQMILEDNIFVEKLLPQMVMRDLAKEEMAVYRRPFLEPGESRRPTLTWPRQIAVDGEPADVDAIIQSYAVWLSDSDVPKLFINADPGVILIGHRREFCRTWPNQTEVTVKGLHYVQEDAPDQIGSALARWLDGIS